GSSVKSFHHRGTEDTEGNARKAYARKLLPSCHLVAADRVPAASLLGKSWWVTLPPPPRSIGIMVLARFCKVILGAQQVTGKILCLNDLCPALGLPALLQL